ncbi:MAG: transposase, partial [Candidatus Thiodiazotropha sp. (ex Lucinoma kastoroae)]|nr:transposase [Candidatus Thiodiazotropha sp. (ex Lucinoma kastoroae)]
MLRSCEIACVSERRPMLIESLITETVELRGFRVVVVQKSSDGLEAELAPDGRYAPCCGVCGSRARYRDTRPARCFRHVPLWGINVYWVYVPRRVVCDYCSGVHVEALPWVSGKRQFGRAKETLEGFFDWFGEERTEQLEGVCCDMWRPYVDVVKARVPKAILVFDKFYIVQHLTKAVDQVRRDEIREKGKAHKELMAKTRYIWLKKPWN